MNQQVYHYLSTKVHYESTTGIFTWAESRGTKIKRGDVIGTDHNGLLKVHVTYDGSVKAVCLHRLAYYIKTGSCPRSVYHRNRNCYDNRSSNLSIDINDTSSDIVPEPKKLPRYVTLESGKYRACPVVGGTPLDFGLFDTIAEARAKVAKWTTNVDAYFKQELPEQLILNATGETK